MEKLTALIVEHIPKVRKKLKDSFSDLDGYEVVDKDWVGVEDAIAFVKMSLTDFVIIEYDLPGIDGVQFGREIRSVLPDVQIIVVAQEADKRIVRKAMRAGACDFLEHDYGPEDFSLALETVLGLIAQNPDAESPIKSSVPAFVVDPEEKRGQIVSVFSPRGGVGKSGP